MPGMMGKGKPGDKKKAAPKKAAPKKPKSTVGQSSMDKMWSTKKYEDYLSKLWK